jgi:glycosyltransferase involved in cell wall biosynthesis
MCKISIALPVYNGANFIKEAIESILAQDYRDYEFIIVDNGSTDETPKIIQTFAKNDNRIKFFAFTKHLGQVENVNRAAQMCTSEWIHFFCHDDIMLQGCIRNVVEAIEKTKSNKDIALISHKPAWLFMNNIVKAPFNVIDKKVIFEYTEFMNKSTVDVINYELHQKRETAQNIINGKGPYLPALTTAIIRKEVFESLGKFSQNYIHFDVFFWMKLVKTFSYLELDKALTLTRIHGSQVAVDGRKSLRTVADNKVFWKQYLKWVTDKPTLKQRAIAFLKPITAATGIMTVTMIRFGFFKSIIILFKLPFYWWPFILLYLPKRYQMEINKNGDLNQIVPVELIYP